MFQSVRKHEVCYISGSGSEAFATRLNTENNSSQTSPVFPAIIKKNWKIIIRLVLSLVKK